MNSTIGQGPEGSCILNQALRKQVEDPDFLEGNNEAIEKGSKEELNKDEISVNSMQVIHESWRKYEFKIEVESQQERNPSDPIRDQDVLEKQIELLQNIHKSLFNSDSDILTANDEYLVDESEIEVLEDNSFLDTFKKIRLIGDTLLSKSVERNLDSPYNCFEEHLMIQCNHQHIHRCIGHYYSQSSDNINLILEDVDENLISYLGTSPSFRTKIRICKEIAQGLWEIHSKKIAHNNLLPESIYVKNGSVRIGNFSKAAYVDDQDSNSSDSLVFDKRNEDIFIFALLMMLCIFNNKNIYDDLLRQRNNPEGISINIEHIVDQQAIPRNNESVVQIIKDIVYSSPENRPKAESLHMRFETLMTLEYDYPQIV